MKNLKGKRYKTEKLQNTRKFSNSSAKWLRRQLNDPYVVKAKELGYRSRASFKIDEIDKKFKLFKKGKRVLDLGSAPGGWSQIAVERVGHGNVIALDILDMDEIDGVSFIKQDFLEPEAEEKVLALAGDKKFDVVMSDMAMNTVGDKEVDHLRTLMLLEAAFDFAIKILKPEGDFVGKIFQGGTEPELFSKIKKNFKVVKHFKPNSSRSGSVEMYLVAKGFKN